MKMAKVDRKFQILDGAMEIFVQKGYSNTTINDIAGRVSLSKGAIYHHFSSKKEIFMSLIAHWETLTFPDFYDKKIVNRGAIKTLEHFADSIVDVYNKRKYVFLAESEFLSLANQDKDFKKELEKLYEKLLNLFDLVINKGIRLGEFKENDSENTSLLLLSGFQTINWMSLFRSEPKQIKFYINNFIAVIIDNIKVENK